MDVEREVTLPAAPDKVWRALTEPGALTEWFGADVDLDPRPGRTATVRRPDGSEERALVEAADPGRRLALRWLPYERGPDGRTRPRPPTRVVFTLKPVDEGTRLLVVEERIGGSGPRSLAEARA